MPTTRNDAQARYDLAYEEFRSVRGLHEAGLATEAEYRAAYDFAEAAFEELRALTPDELAPPVAAGILTPSRDSEDDYPLPDPAADSYDEYILTADSEAPED